MNSYFVILLPSILGIKIYSYLTKEKRISQNITMYLLLLLFSNITSLIISMCFFDIVGNFIYKLETDIILSIKYTIMLIFMNFTYSILFSIIKKYLDVRLEVTYEKE